MIGDKKNSHKIINVTVASLFIFIAMVTSASAGWDYYREIEIDNTKVNDSVDLLDFPVLINHTADWLKYNDTEGYVREPHGYDLVFTSVNNAVILDYEIEEYNGTTGTLVAWVRIPVLDHNDNTKIWLYYGNPDAVDQSNITGVWNDYHAGVWHLSEKIGGTDAIKDSTLNNNDGTDYGGLDLDVMGQIDGADVFDGVDDYVDCGNDESLNITDAITIEAWVKLNEIKRQYIVQKYSGAAYIFASDINPPYTRFRLKIFEEGSSPDKLRYTATNLVAGQWYHLVGTFDSGDIHMYVNGNLDDGEVSGTATSIFPDPADLMIGRYETHYFNGTIDEVRIYNRALSAGEISTQYNNQYSPSTFYSISEATNINIPPAPYRATMLENALLFSVLTILLFAMIFYAITSRRTATYFSHIIALAFAVFLAFLLANYSITMIHRPELSYFFLAIGIVTIILTAIFAFDTFQQFFPLTERRKMEQEYARAKKADEQFMRD